MLEVRRECVCAGSQLRCTLPWQAARLPRTGEAALAARAAPTLNSASGSRPTLCQSSEDATPGFGRAVEEAELSGTTAAAPRRNDAHGPQPARRALVVTPRLAALLERGLAKEAAAKGRCLLAAISPKRRRLRGKQMAPEVMRSAAAATAAVTVSARQPSGTAEPSCSSTAGRSAAAETVAVTVSA